LISNNKVVAKSPAILIRNCIAILSIKYPSSFDKYYAK